MLRYLLAAALFVGAPAIAGAQRFAVEYDNGAYLLVDCRTGQIRLVGTDEVRQAEPNSPAHRVCLILNPPSHSI